VIDGKRVLAVIPARGGSKRLPGKNLKLLLGKPLIQWAWDEARKSNYIDTIQLSSEDSEIISYAQANCISGFQRPVELATDEATLSDVLLHALKVFSDYDLAVLLQPSSPLRTVKDIDCGINLGFSISVGPEGKPNGAVYVVEVPFFLEYPYFGGQVFYMPKDRSVDINTEQDLVEAECYLTLAK